MMMYSVLRLLAVLVGLFLVKTDAVKPYLVHEACVAGGTCITLYKNPYWRKMTYPQTSPLCPQMNKDVLAITDSALQVAVHDVIRRARERDPNVHEVWMSGHRQTAGLDGKWVTLGGQLFPESDDVRDVGDSLTNNCLFVERKWIEQSIRYYYYPENCNEARGEHIVVCTTNRSMSDCASDAAGRWVAGQCYLSVPDTGLDWFGGQNYCWERYQGHLVEEYPYTSGTSGDVLLDSENKKAWIGVWRNPWIWITAPGESHVMTYYNWEVGHGDEVIHRKELCSTIKANGKWKHNSCDREVTEYILCMNKTDSDRNITGSWTNPPTMSGTVRAGSTARIPTNKSPERSTRATPSTPSAATATPPGGIDTVSRDRTSALEPTATQPTTSLVNKTTPPEIFGNTNSVDRETGYLYIAVAAVVVLIIVVIIVIVIGVRRRKKKKQKKTFSSTDSIPEYTVYNSTTRDHRSNGLSLNKSTIGDNFILKAQKLSSDTNFLSYGMFNGDISGFKNSDADVILTSSRENTESTKPQLGKVTYDVTTPDTDPGKAKLPVNVKANTKSSPANSTGAPPGSVSGIIPDSVSRGHSPAYTRDLPLRKHELTYDDISLDGIPAHTVDLHNSDTYSTELPDGAVVTVGDPKNSDKQVLEGAPVGSMDAHSDTYSTELPDGALVDEADFNNSDTYSTELPDGALDGTDDKSETYSKEFPEGAVVGSVDMNTSDTYSTELPEGDAIGNSGLPDSEIYSSELPDTYNDGWYPDVPRVYHTSLPRDGSTISENNKDSAVFKSRVDYVPSEKLVSGRSANLPETFSTQIPPEGRTVNDPASVHYQRIPYHKSVVRTNSGSYSNHLSPKKIEPTNSSSPRGNKDIHTDTIPSETIRSYKKHIDPDGSEIYQIEFNPEGAGEDKRYQSLGGSTKYVNKIPSYAGYRQSHSPTYSSLMPTQSPPPSRLQVHIDDNHNVGPDGDIYATVNKGMKMVWRF